MKVAITGSTGLIGTAVTQRLQRDGHEVVGMTRGSRDNPNALWNPAEGWIRDGALEGVEAVVNLGGENIGGGRWNATRKAALRTSRIDATRLLVDHMRAHGIRPQAFVSSSAVGYYGDRGEERLTESAATGEGFLAQLCADWEAAARGASDLGARVVTLRTGVVIDGDATAFKRLTFPIRMGVGGPLGSGRQWFPWVHLEDAAGVVSHALSSEISGPVNLVAPETLTNGAATKALGRILKRPAFMPVPGVALKVLLGEMAQELLLNSQRVVPAALEQSGYNFHYPTFEAAAREALGRPARA
ncbi:MAG: TIGR01777 family oxidoreductase [Chloroflexi bacterium]|nr:TIGR01777 family oxidoreductase [Chloroflexota bacterium]MDA1239968.1 TIGR01777 family oxidoreductase [Chloroflexota bacterium]